MRLVTPFRRVFLLGLVAGLVVSLLGGAAPVPRGAVQAQEGTGVDTMPAVFTADPDGVMRGYNVDGSFIDDETFEGRFGADPSDLEDLVVDYVTGVNIQSIFGASVIAADADTGRVYVSAGAVIDSSAVGFTILDAGFDEDDRLLTGNLSRENDAGPTQQVPDRAVNEILIVRGDTGLIDVYQYDDAVSGFPIIHIDTLDLGIDDPEHVAVGDIGATEDKESDDDFARFGQDGLAEIIIADPSTGEARVFDNNGEEVDTVGFNLGYGPDDRLVTGNVNGVGGDEILVAHPDTGSVDIFDVSMNPVGGLLRTQINSINVNFDADDQIDLVDVNGTGLEEILVAQADTGDVDVFRYDLVEQTIFSEPSLAVDYSADDLFTALPIRFPDEDGDGLYDHWETHGVDVNGDGIIDIDLPSMGADPRHKDLFVEYDYANGEEPSRAAVHLLKDAFAAAPVDAGGVINPDREPGINLWIDTGDLTEGGQLVGDDLGGGEEVSGSTVPAGGICGIGSDFDDIKEEHFDPIRTHVFRYALSIENPAGCNVGGEAEIGGNDFVEHVNSNVGIFDTIDEAAMFMHELGHNLGLRHGGFEDHNCKPNYISTMNYSHNSGIVRAGGVRTIDYAPAGVTGDERGAAPLPELVEQDLDETQILDPSDDQNMLVYSDPDGDLLRRNVNDEINWNANTDADGNDIIDQEPVAANIDNVEAHSQCANDDILGENNPLMGHNDWRHIVLSVQNGNSSDAGVVEEPDFEEPSIEELIELKEQLNTSDLELDLSVDADPAVAGSEVEFTVTVENLGPNPADEPEVVLELPDGLTFEDSDATCDDENGDVLCTLDWIAANDSTTLAITVLVASDLVFEAGGPTSVTTSATVENAVDAAIDPDENNNAAEIEIDVVAEADLEAVSLAAPGDAIDVFLNEAVEVELDKLLTNHGPSGPIDVALEIETSSSAGLDITATGPDTAEALDVDEQRQVTETLDVFCTEPGLHTVTVTNTVSPLNSEDSDPDTSNNQTSDDLSIECVMPVAINIKPGEAPNLIDVDNPDFVVPLAVLTTEEGEFGLAGAFDATAIDPATALFGVAENLFGISTPDGSAELDGIGRTEDVPDQDRDRSGDGDLDMLLDFPIDGSGLDAFDTEACVRGQADDPVFGEVTFFGCDEIEPSPDVCIDDFTSRTFQPSDLECNNNQQGVVFELDGPLTLCVDPFTGAITAPAEGCANGQQTFLMPDDSPVEACASTFTNALRHTPDGTCQPNETPFVLQ